jgi:hypothetical protein
MQVAVSRKLGHWTPRQLTDAMTAIAEGSSVRVCAKKLNISRNASCSFVKSGSLENAAERRQALSPEKDGNFWITEHWNDHHGKVVTSTVRNY